MGDRSNIKKKKYLAEFDCEGGEEIKPLGFLES